MSPAVMVPVAKRGSVRILCITPLRNAVISLASRVVIGWPVTCWKRWSRSAPVAWVINAEPVAVCLGHQARVGSYLLGAQRIGGLERFLNSPCRKIVARDAFGQQRGIENGGGDRLTVGVRQRLAEIIDRLPVLPLFKRGIALHPG